TTVMAAIVLGWCVVTLVVKEARHETPNNVPVLPDLNEHTNYIVPVKPGEPPAKQDPLGFIGRTGLGEKLRDLHGGEWFSLLGVLGIAIAFGHSILAMSGEETLAQVYREVESPKLPNFKKAAFIVFLYSLGLTASISFLAVLLIPDGERMP